MGTMTEPALDAALNARTAPRVTRENIEAAIARVDYHVLPGNEASPGERVTICQITLKNGFDVRGESACVDPRNFDREIGKHYAHEDAFKKLWPFFGFLLAEQLSERNKMLATAVVPPHVDMVAYIGTKLINARPMSRGAYVAFRGWDLPADEDAKDAGYLVEYTDKLDGNVDGFAGYVTWSPADVFERAYAPV